MLNAPSKWIAFWQLLLPTTKSKYLRIYRWLVNRNTSQRKNTMHPKWTTRHSRTPLNQRLSSDFFQCVNVSRQKLLSELTDRKYFIKEKKLQIRWINKQNCLQNTINCFSKQKTKFFSFLKNTLFTLNKQGSIFETISWETLLEY